MFHFQLCIILFFWLLYILTYVPLFLLLFDIFYMIPFFHSYHAPIFHTLTFICMCRHQESQFLHGCSFCCISLFILCCCCLPTSMTLASGGIRCPRMWSTSSFSVHLASSAVTPAGSTHKSRGDNVVRMRVQLKR